MAKKIKNVKVKYSNEYSDKLWLELYAKRDKLLRMSDWVLLEDSNLTVESLELWKTWRESLRLLTKEKFPNLNKAKAMLHTIRGVTPKAIYNKSIEKREYMSTEDKVTIGTLRDNIEQLNEDVASLASILSKIREDNDVIQQMRKDDICRFNRIFEELKQEISAIQPLAVELPPAETQEFIPEDEILPLNLNEAKSILIKLAKTWYFNEFYKITDVPMSILSERCEQAIDYTVSGNLSLVPLVAKYSDISGLSPEEVAVKFIDDKKELLRDISDLDGQRWKIESTIETSKSVEDLEDIKTSLYIA